MAKVIDVVTGVRATTDFIVLWIGILHSAVSIFPNTIVYYNTMTGTDQASNKAFSRLGRAARAAEISGRQLGVWIRYHRATRTTAAGTK